MCTQDTVDDLITPLKHGLANQVVTTHTLCNGVLTLQFDGSMGRDYAMFDLVEDLKQADFYRFRGDSFVLVDITTYQDEMFIALIDRKQAKKLFALLETEGYPGNKKVNPSWLAA